MSVLFGGGVLFSCCFHGVCDVFFVCSAAEKKRNGSENPLHILPTRGRLRTRAAPPSSPHIPRPPARGSARAGPPSPSTHAMAAPAPPPAALAVLPPTKRDLVLSFWVYIPPVELYLALADRQAVRVSGWGGGRGGGGRPVTDACRAVSFVRIASRSPNTPTPTLSQGRALFLRRSLAYAQLVPR